MKGIIKRALTGSLYVAIMVSAMICGPIVFAIVFSIIIILGILECNKLCNNGKTYTKESAIDVFGGLLMFLATFLSYYKPEYGINPIISYLPYIAIRFITQLYIKQGDSSSSLKSAALSQLYVALPITILNTIYFSYGTPQLLLAGLIFIWMNDTGAYCVGSLIGKNRLFERISPKKSWEGFFGGMVFTILTGVAFCSYFSGYFGNMGLTNWIIYSILVSVFATWGDLIESMLKRAVGAKDSGNILPGHGGILDRIDSLLLVSIISAIFFYLIR